MSCALARDVLDHQSLKPTWSWNATERSSAHEGSRFFPASEDGYWTADTEGVQVFPTSEDDYSTADTEAYARTPSEEKGEGSARYNDRVPLRELFAHALRPDSEAERSSHSNVDTGVLRKKLFEREEAMRRGQHISLEEDLKFDRLENLLVSQQEAKYEKEKAKKKQATERAAKEAEEREAAHAKAVQEAKAMAEELEKARAIAQKKMNAPLTFHDAVGRKFECPWHLCSTWEVSSSPTCSTPSN